MQCYSTEILCTSATWAATAVWSASNWILENLLRFRIPHAFFPPIIGVGKVGIRPDGRFLSVSERLMATGPDLSVLCGSLVADRASGLDATKSLAAVRAKKFRRLSGMVVASNSLVSFNEMTLWLARRCAGTTPEMRNHDRGYSTRGIEEGFLPRVCEKRTLRLADKAFQCVPQLESGGAKHRHHFLCGMGHGINLHRILAVPKPRAPTGGVGRGVKACDEEIRRLLQHARPLGRDCAQLPNMLHRKGTDRQVKYIARERKLQAVGSGQSSSHGGLLLGHRQHGRRQVNPEARRAFCSQQLLQPAPGTARQIEHALPGDVWNQRQKAALFEGEQWVRSLVVGCRPARVTFFDRNPAGDSRRSRDLLIDSRRDRRRDCRRGRGTADHKLSAFGLRRSIMRWVHFSSNGAE